ncbi:MAG: helix-hairpin-helix domain-containing protein [Eubacterium sp.]|nr:helix-hairpin-helix domain-containing protein [Eubacterium sp.]MDD7209792.1 helix-hairpin-helix domain-containing protein [Lachnospiraceae bacterium]MDY5497666.1 helix-hairpin-helix domain-containing protein [Anaerobutyricum sp.]
MKQKRQNKWLTVFSLIFVVLLCGCSFSSPLREEESEISTEIREETMEDTKRQEESGIYVHVCGCVKHPGLYRLPDGARAQEAVEAAGGFTKKADQTAWNLAEILQDGTQMKIPSRKESRSDEESSDSDKNGRININTASKEQLMTLPGIGASRADAVIACREEKGSFTAIEDIKDTEGIGQGIFNRIKDFITVD